MDLGLRCSACSIAHSSQVFGEYSYSQYDPLLIAHLLSQMSADNVCRRHLLTAPKPRGGCPRVDLCHAMQALLLIARRHTPTELASLDQTEPWYQCTPTGRTMDSTMGAHVGAALQRSVGNVSRSNGIGRCVGGHSHSASHTYQA